jgi:hypothetical protein
MACSIVCVDLNAWVIFSFSNMRLTLFCSSYGSHERNFWDICHFRSHTLHNTANNLNLFAPVLVYSFEHYNITSFCYQMDGVILYNQHQTRTKKWAQCWLKNFWLLDFTVGFTQKLGVIRREVVVKNLYGWFVYGIHRLFSFGSFQVDVKSTWIILALRVHTFENTDNHSFCSNLRICTCYLGVFGLIDWSGKDWIN